MRKLYLPYPHPGQQQVLRESKRFNVLVAGRRWRKTTLCLAVAIPAMCQGRKVLWAAPTFKQSKVGWGEAKKAMAGHAQFHETDMVCYMHSTGGSIHFVSLEKFDNIRGLTIDLIILDETADIDPRAYYEVLKAMILDTSGIVWMVGTPKGLNWFWKEFQQAKDRPQDSMAWQIPSYGCEITEAGLVRKPHVLENPDLNFADFENLYATTPERVFRQEYLAEFIVDGGGVFRNIDELADAFPQHSPIPGHIYIGGLDYGQAIDYTVFTIIDCNLFEAVKIDRFGQLPWDIQRGRIQRLNDTFRPLRIVDEINNMGLSWHQDLLKDGLPMDGFSTQKLSKQTLIEDLALAFEKGLIHTIKDANLQDELKAFQAWKSPTGHVRYAAPPGVHDDCVMSLALAWSARLTSSIRVLGASKLTDWSKETGIDEAKSITQTSQLNWGQNTRQSEMMQILSGEYSGIFNDPRF